jgi:dephospho-CoA kinase
MRLGDLRPAAPAALLAPDGRRRSERTVRPALRGSWAMAPKRGPIATEIGSLSAPLIGLTGGQGAGKSTALEALAQLGAATISADALVHELYERPQIRAALAARLGAHVLDGAQVDRGAVARAVFAQPAEREWLEQLLWPRVRELIATRAAQARACEPPPRAVVAEVALLFEAGLESRFDATVAILADDATRAQRLGARGHVAVTERDQRQLSQQEKARRATYVVRNDGSPADLTRELRAVLQQITEAAR